MRKAYVAKRKACEDNIRAYESIRKTGGATTSAGGTN